MRSCPPCQPSTHTGGSGSVKGGRELVDVHQRKSMASVPNIYTVGAVENCVGGSNVFSAGSDLSPSRKKKAVTIGRV
jgi:hypothetical protein